MKIALTSIGKDLDAQLDERFGRCAYFIIVDSETYDFKVIDNSRYMNKGEDTGINTTKFLLNGDIKVLITKNIGPRAFDKLDEVNIQIFMGRSGTIREMIHFYIEGDLRKINEPNVDNYFGLY